jgi:hypothetical protein
MRSASCEGRKVTAQTDFQPMGVNTTVGPLPRGSATENERAGQATLEIASGIQRGQVAAESGLRTLTE